MDSSEVNNLVRHRIVSLIIRIEGTSPSDEKSTRKLPLKLKSLIETPALKDRAVIFKRLENEPPGFHIFLPMQHINNIQFLSELTKMYGVNFDWKTQDSVTIYIEDIKQVPISYLSPKCITTSVCYLLPPRVLLENTKKLMQLFDDVANSADAKKTLESMQHSVLEIAKKIGEANAKAHMFGSRMTGLADWKSDVDLYVETGDTFCTGTDTDRQRKLVSQFQEVMTAQPHLYSNLLPMVSSQYMAVLRFRHIELDLECDLSFRSGMSVTNNKLMKTYLQIDPRVKYVICGVKWWLKKTDQKMNFLSCAQTWLALFFLMKRNVVPTVDALRNMLPTHERISMIQGWNCAFPDITRVNWSSTCPASREELLKEFFAFYSDNASWLQSHILCTFSGEMRSKVEFMNGCKSKYSAIEFAGIMRDFRGPLCILDPFVHIKNLNRFSRYCEKSFCMFVEYCRQTKDMPL